MGDSTPLLAGWLTKRGGFRKSWKRRWFVLFENFSLNYYKCSPEKPSQGCTVCRGAVSASVPSTPTALRDYHDNDAYRSAPMSSSSKRPSVSSSSASSRSTSRRSSNSSSLNTMPRVRMTTTRGGAGAKGGAAARAAATPRCGEKCGTIDLREITSIRASQEKSVKPFTIEMVTKKRTWYLAAESEADREEWIQAIKSTQISTWINSDTALSPNLVDPADATDELKPASPRSPTSGSADETSWENFVSDFGEVAPPTPNSKRSKSAANTPRTDGVGAKPRPHRSITSTPRSDRHRQDRDMLSVESSSLGGMSSHSNGGRRRSSVSESSDASLDSFPSSFSHASSNKSGAGESSRKKNPARRKSEFGYSSKPRGTRAKSTSLPRTGVNPLTGARGGGLMAGVRGGGLGAAGARGGPGNAAGGAQMAFMNELNLKLEKKRRAPPSPVMTFENAAVKAAPASPLEVPWAREIRAGSKINAMTPAQPLALDSSSASAQKPRVSDPKSSPSTDAVSAKDEAPQKNSMPSTPANSDPLTSTATATAVRTSLPSQETSTEALATSRDRKVSPSPSEAQATTPTPIKEGDDTSSTTKTPPVSLLTVNAPPAAPISSSGSSSSSKDKRERDLSEVSMSDSRGAGGDETSSRSRSSSATKSSRPRSQSSSAPKYPLSLRGQRVLMPQQQPKQQPRQQQHALTPTVGRDRNASSTRPRSRSKSISAPRSRGGPSRKQPLFQRTHSVEQPPEDVELDEKPKPTPVTYDYDAGPSVDLSKYSPKKLTAAPNGRKVPTMKRQSTGSLDEATAVRRLALPATTADWRKLMLLSFRKFITPADLLDELLEYFLQPITTEKRPADPPEISDDDPSFQRLGDESGSIVWVPQPDEDFKLDEISRLRQHSRAKTVASLKYWIEGPVYSDNDFSEAMCDKLREVSDAVDALNAKNCPAGEQPPPTTHKRPVSEFGLSLQDYLDKHVQVSEDESKKAAEDKFDKSVLEPRTPTVLSLQPVLAILNKKKEAAAKEAGASSRKSGNGSRKSDDDVDINCDQMVSPFEHLALEGKPVRYPGGPNGDTEAPMNLLDITPLAAAQQLTLIVFDMFRKINLVEFTDTSWKRKQPKAQNPPPPPNGSGAQTKGAEAAPSGSPDAAAANCGGEAASLSSVALPASKAQVMKRSPESHNSMSQTHTGTMPMSPTMIKSASAMSPLTQYSSPGGSNTMSANKVNSSPILRSATVSPETLSRMSNESKAQHIQRAATLAPELMEGLYDPAQGPYGSYAPYGDDSADPSFSLYEECGPQNAFSEQLMQVVDSQMKFSDSRTSPLMHATPTAGSPLSSQTHTVSSSPPSANFPGLPRAATAAGSPLSSQTHFVSPSPSSGNFPGLPRATTMMPTAAGSPLSSQTYIMSPSSHSGNFSGRSRASTLAGSPQSSHTHFVSPSPRSGNFPGLPRATTMMPTAAGSPLSSQTQFVSPRAGNFPGLPRATTMMPAAAGSPLSSQTQFVSPSPRAGNFPGLPRATTMMPTSAGSPLSSQTHMYGAPAMSPLSQQTMPLVSGLPRASTMIPNHLAHTHTMSSPRNSSASPSFMLSNPPLTQSRDDVMPQYLSRSHLVKKPKASPQSAYTVRSSRTPPMRNMHTSRARTPSNADPSPRSPPSAAAAPAPASTPSARPKTLPSKASEIRGSKGSARKLRKLMGANDFIAAQNVTPEPASSKGKSKKASKKSTRSKRSNTMTGAPTPTSSSRFSMFRKQKQVPASAVDLSSGKKSSGATMSPFEYLASEPKDVSQSPSGPTQSESSKPSPFSDLNSSHTASTMSSPKKATELRHHKEALSIDFKRPGKDATHVLQLDGHVVTPETPAQHERAQGGGYPSGAGMYDHAQSPDDFHLFAPSQTDPVHAVNVIPESGRDASASVSVSVASTASMYTTGFENSRSYQTGYSGDTPSVSSGTDAESNSGEFNHNEVASAPVSSHGVHMESASLQNPQQFNFNVVDQSVGNSSRAPNNTLLATQQRENVLLSVQGASFRSTDASSVSSQPAATSDPSSASSASPSPRPSTSSNGLSGQPPMATRADAAVAVHDYDYDAVEMEEIAARDLEDDPPDFAPPVPGIVNPDSNVHVVSPEDPSVVVLNPESTENAAPNPLERQPSFAPPPSPDMSRARPRWLSNANAPVASSHRSKSANPPTDRLPPPEESGPSSATAATTDRRPGRTAMNILLGGDRGAGHAAFALKKGSRGGPPIRHAPPSESRAGSRGGPPNPAHAPPAESRADPRFGPMPSFTAPSRPNIVNPPVSCDSALAPRAEPVEQHTGGFPVHAATITTAGGYPTAFDYVQHQQPVDERMLVDHNARVGVLDRVSTVAPSTASGMSEAPVSAIPPTPYYGHNSPQQFSNDVNDQYSQRPEAEAADVHDPAAAAAATQNHTPSTLSDSYYGRSKTQQLPSRSLELDDFSEDDSESPYSESNMSPPTPIKSPNSNDNGGGGISLASPAAPPGARLRSQSQRPQKSSSRSLAPAQSPYSSSTLQAPPQSSPKSNQPLSASVRVPHRRKPLNRSIHALSALHKDIQARKVSQGVHRKKLLSTAGAPAAEAQAAAPSRTGRFAPPTRMSSKEALAALKRTKTSPAESASSPRHHNTMPVRSNSRRGLLEAAAASSGAEDAQTMATMSQQVKRMPDFSELRRNPDDSSSAAGASQQAPRAPDRNTIAARSGGAPRPKVRSRGVDVAAPNAISFINQFNQISYWAATEVLCTADAADRVRMLRHVLKIADECLRLQNLHTSLAIANGVQLVSVDRLTHLKEMIGNDNDHHARLSRLKALLSIENQHETYRVALNQCLMTKRPCIPWMAIAFNDLYIMQQRQKKLHREGKINFRALKSSAKLIYQIQSCQLTDYRTIIKEDRVARAHLTELVGSVLTEKELYDRSYDIEPQVANKKDRKRKKKEKKRSGAEGEDALAAMPEALAMRLKAQMGRGRKKDTHTVKRSSPPSDAAHHGQRRRRSSVTGRSRQGRVDELSSAPVGGNTSGSRSRRGRSRFASNLLSIGSRGAFGSGLNKAIISAAAEAAAAADNEGAASSSSNAPVRSPNTMPKRSRSAFGQRATGGAQRSTMMAQRASSRAHAAAASRS